MKLTHWQKIYVGFGSFIVGLLVLNQKPSEHISPEYYIWAGYCFIIGGIILFGIGAFNYIRRFIQSNRH